MQQTQPSRTAERLDDFTLAYIECALWASDTSYDGQGEPLDYNHDRSDLAPETLEAMKADCERFQREHGDDIRINLERAGHDFWLTRNGHGAGFWDGDWPEEAGNRLTDACRAYKSVMLLIGDDGSIYQEPA